MLRVNKESLRIKNSNILLRLVKQASQISRAELSTVSGLNKASVSDIARVLLSREIIKEVGSGDSSQLGGRKPILLEFNDTVGVAIGIDIGVNSIRTYISYLDGIEIDKEEHTYDQNDVLNHVKHIIDTFVEKYSDLKYGVVGVTISIHGAVYNNKIIFTPNYDILDIEKLVNLYKFPILFENEANLAALSNSEQTNFGNSATITLRTGIGAGIVFDEGLFYGEEGGAGELGHTIVFPKGRQCPCGNKGCLERYASTKAIIQSYRDIKKDSTLELDDFIKSVNSNDLESNVILDDTAEFLAVGITNFITLYAPKKIYLLGTIIDEFPQIIASIKDKMTGIFVKHVKIEKSHYGKYSSAHGAVIHTIDNFIDEISNEY